jgi:hypothetical protein
VPQHTAVPPPPHLIIRAVTVSVTIPHGTNGGKTAVCPPGFVVTGGGYGGPPKTNKTVITLSGVVGTTGWVVAAFNGNTFDAPMFVEAVCPAIQP